MKSVFFLKKIGKLVLSFGSVPDHVKKVIFERFSELHFFNFFIHIFRFQKTNRMPFAIVSENLKISFIFYFLFSIFF